MSLPHFFVDAAILGRSGELLDLALPPDVLAHLHTLRAKAGEKIVLVDAPGHGWETELCTAVDKRSGAISAHLLRELSAVRTYELCLVQGISAAERMDMTVRQCTEIGVARILPLMSERSTVRLNAATCAGKRERWQRVAKSAAEQSCQLFLPEIDPPMRLADALDALVSFDLLLLFWEEAGGRSVAHAIRQVRARAAKDTSLIKAAIFIGPEGGFSAREVEMMELAGAELVSMGDTILRTETAAVVASALTLYQMGALGATLTHEAQTAGLGSGSRT